MTVIWKRAELEAGAASVAPLHEQPPAPVLLSPEPLPGPEAAPSPAVRRQLRLLNRLAAELVQERERLLMDLRPDLLALALGIAEQIVRHDCARHREIALQTLTEALEQLHFASKVVVRLHPDDLAALQEHPGVERHGVELQFVAEPEIEPGGCRLETDRGSLDATIATQLGRMRKLLGQHGAAE